MITRGVDRREIFRDDVDRCVYCDQLSIVFREDGATCLAWALLPNHVHLAVRTGSRPLARVMQRVGTRYGCYFNRRYGRVGYLFQGRYKAIAVEDDAHLATLIRYIHRNPLRAGLVASLEDLARYRWTGHGALIGRAEAESFHAWSEALRLFDDRESVARAAVRALMESDDEETLREAPIGEPVGHGQDAAIPWIVEPSRVDPELALAELVRSVCKAQGIGEAELRSRCRRRDVSLARATVGYLAFRSLGISLAETARHLGVARQSLWERLEDGRRAASQHRRPDAETT